MRKPIFTIIAFFLVFAFFPTQIANSQNNTTYPFYTIQPGETIFQIAQNFGVTIDEIININNIQNPDFISPGTQIFIPGLTGISGEITSQVINIGDTFNSIVRKTGVNAKILSKLNRKTSPAEIFAGSSLILPKLDQNFYSSFSLLTEESVIEMAISIDSNPWVPIVLNSLESSFSLVPSEVVFFPSIDEKMATSSISTFLNSVTISPLPLIQGTTAIINVSSKVPVKLSGILNGNQIPFFNINYDYYGLNGIHALANTGMTTFSLNGEFENGHKFSIEQSILLKSGNYANDPPINVKDVTIDPNITNPEDEFVRSLISNVTTEKYWSGKFIDPVDSPICYKSVFGSRRSYNGSDYIYFHTGLDYGVCAPILNIYAAESGKVVFAGELTVRGNAIFIDHGQGVYSGYFHASEIKVNAGEMVEKGKLIGIIGATGRVTGPHLHFEIIINGSKVNPLNQL